MKQWTIKPSTNAKQEHRDCYHGNTWLEGKTMVGISTHKNLHSSEVRLVKGLSLLGALHVKCILTGGLGTLDKVSPYKTIYNKGPNRINLAKGFYCCNY